MGKRQIVIRTGIRTEPGGEAARYGQSICFYYERPSPVALALVAAQGTLSVCRSRTSNRCKKIVNYFVFPFLLCRTDRRALRRARTGPPPPGAQLLGCPQAPRNPLLRLLPHQKVPGRDRVAKANRMDRAISRQRRIRWLRLNRRRAKISPGKQEQTNPSRGSRLSRALVQRRKKTPKRTTRCVLSAER